MFATEENYYFIVISSVKNSAEIKRKVNWRNRDRQIEQQFIQESEGGGGGG